MAGLRHENARNGKQIGGIIRSVFLSASLCVYAASISAAEPNIRTVSLRGLQVGGTTTLTIDGDDLGTSPKLLLPFPTKQTLKGKTTEKQATFEVTLGDDVPPGFAQLRVATSSGVSLPVIMAVDGLPQKPFTSTAGSGTTAFAGTISGSAVAETTVKGKAGQKFQVEIEAARLGSKLRAVLHLYGSNRLQLAWAWPSPATFGDCKLTATLPADGEYTVAIHDVEYAAGAGSFFRLKLGEWDSIDAVFPPAIAQGVTKLELLGPGEPILEEVLGMGAGHEPQPLPWPKGRNWSGARAWVLDSGHLELVEQPSSGKPQDLPAEHVGISGKHLVPYEEDRYRISAKPGTKLKIEAFAERIGSPADVTLLIRNEAGAVAVKAEDGTSTLDPAFEYTVPAKSNGVILGVADAQGRGGPRAIYRVVVEPITPDSADFALTTTAPRLTLVPGTRVLFPVLVERKGYDGEIEIGCENLPPGTKLENATIPSGADGTLVSVLYKGNSSDAAITRWAGSGTAKGRVVRPVLVKDHPLERLQPWLAREIAVAPIAAAKDEFAVDWNKLPEATKLTPGAKLSLPVKVTRPTSNAVVKLTLVTSQAPRSQGNQAAMQTLRADTPAGVDLAAKAMEGALPITVPPQLPGPVYDLAVKAELLTADKKTVLATAFTPVKRLSVASTKKK